MAETKIYPASNETTERLIAHVTNYLERSETMQTQQIESEDGNFTIVQARVRGGSFKQFVGMDKVVTLRFVRGAGVVNVEVGETKWIDKTLVGTLSMFVLWPLAVTTIFGVYKQKKLITNILKTMDDFMMAQPKI